MAARPQEQTGVTMTAIPEDVRERARGVLTGRRLAFDNEAGLAALIEAIAAFALSEREAAQLEERARAAKIAEDFPARVLGMWPRPGGPPGNGWRASTSADIAAAILQEPKE